MTSVVIFDNIEVRADVRQGLQIDESRIAAIDDAQDTTNLVDQSGTQGIQDLP